MKKLIISISISSMLTGCASPYVPSESGPKAKLRLAASDSLDRTEFYVVDKGKCPVPDLYSLADIASLSMGEKSNLNMLGMPANERQYSSRERIIDADKPIYIHAIRTRPATEYVSGYTCSVGGVFFPKPDAQYEITYTLESNRCRLNFMSLVLVENDKVNRMPEPSARAIPAYDLRNYCNY